MENGITKEMVPELGCPKPFGELFPYMDFPYIDCKLESFKELTQNNIQSDKSIILHNQSKKDTTLKDCI